MRELVRTQEYLIAIEPSAMNQALDIAISEYWQNEAGNKIIIFFNSKPLDLAHFEGEFRRRNTLLIISHIFDWHLESYYQYPSLTYRSRLNLTNSINIRP